MIKSGKTEGLPYSLSRWTDVPGDPGKWAWFMGALHARRMMAFDPRTAIPAEWSLDPDDTLGLVFWTKNPSTLVAYRDLLAGYRVKVYVTVTGWHEVEKGAPSLRDGTDKLAIAADQFGPENVTWRFSPVPAVPDVVDRFASILPMARHYGVRSVYLSFLQANDLLPETRTEEERRDVLVQVAEVAARSGVRVYLCAEDRLLSGHPGLHANLASGVCAPPEDFALPNRERLPSEGCGCVLMVDPFTVNESCTMGCEYCYAGDRTLSTKKRNTTRNLPVVR